MVFLNRLQNTQKKNTCVDVSFLIKVSDWRLDVYNFVKMHSDTDFFLWMLLKGGLSGRMT